MGKGGFLKVGQPALAPYTGEFARVVGITPESFSRAVTDFAGAGVVRRLGRGRFQVLDPQALRAAAFPADL